jgi:hypothetical protein
MTKSDSRSESAGLAMQLDLPINHKNRETPTEPVAAKIPEGVEKTA